MRAQSRGFKAQGESTASAHTHTHTLHVVVAHQHRQAITAAAAASPPPAPPHTHTPVTKLLHTSAVRPPLLAVSVMLVATRSMVPIMAMAPLPSGTKYKYTDPQLKPYLQAVAARRHVHRHTCKPPKQRC